MVATAATAVVGIDDLDISIDDDFAEETPQDHSFVGEIVIDQYEPDDKGGYKWHVGVKPLGFTIGGATGAFHSWPKVKPGEKPKENSATGQMIQAIKSVFGKKPDGTSYRIGKGDLLGLVAMFERKDYSFGVNKKTGEEIVAKQLLFAVAPAEGYSTEGPAKSASAALLTDDELNVVVALAQGKTFREVKAAAVADSSLDQQLRARIIGKTALVFAVDQGRLVLDGDKYVVAPF